jgi:hypothetical protein
MIIFMNVISGINFIIIRVQCVYLGIEIKILCIKLSFGIIYIYFNVYYNTN